MKATYILTLIVGFNTQAVSNDTIDPGSNTVHWSPSQSIECTTNTSEISGDKSVQLSCNKSAPQVMTVNVSTGGGKCDPSVYPPLQQNKVEKTYASVNDGYNFGEHIGSSIKETFGLTQFLALSNLSTDKVNFYRSMSTYPSPTDLQAWWGVTWSISQCPGDFTPSALCTGVIYPYGAISISTDPEPFDDYTCVIQRNTDYYLNFVHDTEPFDSSLGRCNDQSHLECAIFTVENHAGPRTN